MENELSVNSSDSSSKPNFAAHTPNASGRWQTMEEHVDGVSRRAEAFAAAFGMREWGRAAASLHDIGKGGDAFQRYLKDCFDADRNGEPKPRRNIDHKSAGAWRAWKEMNNSLLSMILFGHHGGLPAPSELRDQLTKAEAIPGFNDAIERSGELPAPIGLPEWARSSRLASELFCRMLFSCLTDADSLDTEEHFKPEIAASRGDETPLTQYRDRLLANQALLMESASTELTVNRIRREVYDACLEAATLPPGVFRLTVPTGGGKTRSSLAFALEHAIRHGLERIIYAIPYTSIIDQTAGTFREIFGEGDDAPQVIEHHSALPEPIDDRDETASGAETRHRLACDNWDARLIVTTTVQLFESLFSRKPGRCRKVHRLANCVLILDEAQTLPLPFLAPITDALRLLSERFGTTVVLCTATQPALQGDSPYLKGFADPKEIVPVKMRDRHFQELKRVEYRIESDAWSWERVAEEMIAEPQCMTVLNARKDALRSLDALEAIKAEGALHLSTLLCGAHRKKVLREVKERLDAGAPVRLVSTQVAEAGVDLDFPRVFRAIGPLDRIIQAAGRCNREGRLALGTMTVFHPEKGSSPRGAYKTAMDEATIFLKRDGLDLHDPVLIDEYFRSLYALTDTDSREINKSRNALDFPATERKFRMISEDSVSVLVPYDANALDELIREAREAERLTRQFWRRAQPHVVSLPRWEFDEKRAMIEEIVPESLFVWRGGYDRLRGVVGIARDPNDLIF